jgi:hypothetical protein
MLAYYRPSSEIERQIADFNATLPEGINGPPKGDFAAQLQWDSWQYDLKQLNMELEASIDQELVGADVLLAIDGDPVSGHAVQAGFLGIILAKAQSLINALAQASEHRPTGRGNVRNNIIADYRLMVDGVFQSSFGLKLRLPTQQELNHLRVNHSESVLDDFCHLIDPDLDQTELLQIVSSPRVKTQYLGLIEAVGKGGAKLLARTPRIRHGVRINAAQARDRATWMSSFSAETETLVLEGFLTGGSVANNKFEFQMDDETYRGGISAQAKEKMRTIHFGDRARATIEQTTMTAEEGHLDGAVTHHLKSIEPIQNDL